MSQLEGIEKAICQILLAYGVVSDAKLNNFIASLRVDFPPNRPQEYTLQETFKRANAFLTDLSLEIRTVVIVGDNDERTSYHGLINTESDAIAIANGIQLKPVELVFFKAIIEKLAIEQYLSTSEVLQLRPREWASNQLDTERYLNRLYEGLWLQRDDRNFWEIGPRTHLELRSLIEQVLTSEENGGDENNQFVHRLPQVLFY